MYIGTAKTISGLGNAMAVNSKEVDYNFPNVMYTLFLRKDKSKYNLNMKYVDFDHLLLLMQYAQTKELTKIAGKYLRGGFMEKKNSSIIIRLITGEIKGIASFFLDSIIYFIMTVKIWVSCNGRK